MILGKCVVLLIPACPLTRIDKRPYQIPTIMADDPPKPTMSEQRRSDQLPSNEPNAAAEITQLRRELEIVKNAV